MWLRGNATDKIETIAQTDHHLDLMARLLDALAVVDDILDTRNTPLDSSGDQRTSENESDLVNALERVRDFGPAWDASAIESAYATLRTALDATGDVTQGTVERIKETVLPALAIFTKRHASGAPSFGMC